MPLVGIDVTWCHLFASTIVLAASLLPLTGRHPSAPWQHHGRVDIATGIRHRVASSWVRGSIKLGQFNFSPLMPQITAFGCWCRRKFTWNIEVLQIWSLVGQKPQWVILVTLILNLIHIIFQLMNFAIFGPLINDQWSMDGFSSFASSYRFCHHFVRVLANELLGPVTRCVMPTHSVAIPAILVVTIPCQNTFNTGCHHRLYIRVRILAILLYIMCLTSCYATGTVHWHISKTRDRSRAHISKWKDSLNFWGPYK